MSLTVRDIMDAMEAWAPARLAYAWDKAGLAIGESGAPVSRVLTCLSVTREAYRAAKRARAEMIVAHHPVIWEPLAALRTDDPHTRLCLDIAQAGMACFTAHTNLDVVPGGVNSVLAERLGLVERRPLFPAPQAGQVKLVCFVPEAHLPALRDAVARAGAGRIGAYTHCTFSSPGTGTFKPEASANPFLGTREVLNEEPELRFETLVSKSILPRVLDALLAAHPYEEPAYDVCPVERLDPEIGLGVRGELPKPLRLDAFAAQVCDALGLKHVRAVGESKRRVRTVAVLGGAGGSEAGKIPGDIDVYVTGDVKYHDALSAAERGLALIDAGHRGTEHAIVPAMAHYLRGKVSGLRVSSYNEQELFQAIVRPAK